MKLKNIPTASIVLTILAIGCIIWSAYQYSVYRQGDYISDIESILSSDKYQEGKTVSITGKVVEDQLPRDTMNGVYADCLVLERKVEMYQYTIENDTVYTAYSSDFEGTINGINGEQYVNPAFPEGLDSAMFFGTAKLEDTELSVGPRILREYTSDNGHSLIGNLVEFDNKYGLKPDGDGGYDNCKGDSPEIGDIRVTYTAWISSDYDESVIIGTIRNGVIGYEDDIGMCSIDFEASSPEEIHEKYYSEYMSNYRSLAFVSIVLLVIAAAVFFFRNRKSGQVRNAVMVLCIATVITAATIPGKADFGDYGGDYDYGGYDSYDSYDSYDYDYDYDDYDYDYDSGNNNVWYFGTPDEPETTAYYSAVSASVRQVKLFNTEGMEIHPEPVTDLTPNFGKLETPVTGIMLFDIFAATAVGVTRKKKRGGNNSRHSGGTGNRKQYIPGAEKTDASELNDIDAYVDIDPNFSLSEYEEKLSNLYIRLQNGWQNKDLESIRPYLSDAFYSQCDTQLDRYRRNRQTNIIEKIAVLDVSITGWKQERDKDIIIAVMRTRINDYVTDDETGEIVSGSKLAEKFMTYEWRMERTSGLKTGETEGLTAQNCPNCGAPVDINHTAKCEYCGSILTNDTFDWVLTSIKGISQRTVNR